VRIFKIEWNRHQTMNFLKKCLIYKLRVCEFNFFERCGKRILKIGLDLTKLCVFLEGALCIQYLQQFILQLSWCYRTQVESEAGVQNYQINYHCSTERALIDT